MNARSAIVRGYLNNMFKLEKKQIGVKDLGAYFTLKISANQDLEPVLPDIAQGFVAKFIPL